MYNKKKREVSEDIIYSRFVLSSMRIKELILEDDEMRDKKAKKSTRSGTDKTEIVEEGEEAYDIDEEVLPIEREETKEDEEEGEEDKPKTEERKIKNKLGYVFTFQLLMNKHYIF